MSVGWQETILVICNETARKVNSVDQNIVINFEVTFINCQDRNIL